MVVQDHVLSEMRLQVRQAEEIPARELSAWFDAERSRSNQPLCSLDWKGEPSYKSSDED